MVGAPRSPNGRIASQLRRRPTQRTRRVERLGAEEATQSRVCSVGVPSMRRTLCPQLFHGTTLSLRALSISHLNERCASWKLWRSEVSEWYEEEQQQRWCQETDDEDEPDEEKEEFNTSAPLASSSTRCDRHSLPTSRRDQLAEEEAADAIEMHEWYEEQCEHDSRHLSRWRASAERLRNFLHAQGTQMGCCCCGAPG